MTGWYRFILFGGSVCKRCYKAGSKTKTELIFIKAVSFFTVLM